MYKVVTFGYDNGYFITDEQDFDKIVEAINFASLSGRCYVILKNYGFFSAAHMVARSSYESWSPLK